MNGTLASLWTRLYTAITTAGDLAAVAVLTGVSGWVLGCCSRPVIALIEPFGTVLVFIAPGYAIVSALFPGTRSNTDEGPHQSVTLTQRIVYSVAISPIVAGLVGVGLSFVGVGITRQTVLPTLTMVTVIAIAVALLRRRSVDETPVDECLSIAQKRYVADGGIWSIAGTAVLVVVVITAGSVVAVTIPDGGTGEQFTEFYLLSVDDTGNSTASDYPTVLTTGDRHQVVVGIQNHEQHPQNYTVIPLVQRVGTNRTTTVQRLAPLAVSLAHDESREVDRDIRVTVTGDDLRLAFLLYRGSPPDSPTLDNGYREVHLWVTVEQT